MHRSMTKRAKMPTPINDPTRGVTVEEVGAAKA
jgi:hypothetical protein